ncbi:MAG: hypothetical protein U1F43_28080 [Myxococcota bacterium]
MMSRLVLAFATVIALGVPMAHAGDPGGAAQLHAKAQEAMAAGRYSDAAELFHAAYELDSAPELLWNEARARHLAGELVKARDLYKEFIQRDDAPAALRGKANDSIVEITLELEKPPDKVEPETHDDTFGTVMVATGGALVLGGVISHIVSFGAADDMATFAQPSPTLDDATRLDKYQSAKSTRDTTQALAIAGYAVGGAVLVTGIVSLILSDDPEPPADHVQVEPWWSPGAVGANARLRF